MKRILLLTQKYRHLYLPLLIAGVILGVYLNINGGFPMLTSAAAPTTVTFGSVGDSNDNSNSSAVLRTIKGDNLDFFLHVGDFSYDRDGERGARNWPVFVKNIVGKVFPFEIVMGNHDKCCIATYVSGLPNKLPGVKGRYGVNYYFDYPQNAPLMRAIMISIGMDEPGTAWLASAIDSARAAKIPWVVVGYHLNCLSASSNNCQAGLASTQLLHSKRVDLILQGHEHNYQRTKQLSCVTRNTVNKSCIAANGPDFKQGPGAITVLNGAAGNGFKQINTNDTEYGYFAKLNDNTFGYTKFTVTANQIVGQFIRAAGGQFTDTFTITRDATTTIAPPFVNPTYTRPTYITPTYVTPTYVCIGGYPCASLVPTYTGSNAVLGSKTVQSKPCVNKNPVKQKEQTKIHRKSASEMLSVTPTPNPCGTAL